MSNKTYKTYKRGAALLVVLFVVMAITVLSLGFLSRSDVELACGRNMGLRTEMDYLAESGLAHAKGLIISPQDVNSEYWTGAEGLQLVEGGNDYYDVSVSRHDPDSGLTYRCNYRIRSCAYRNKGGEKVGRSNLTAELRLDPCIALWMGKDTTVSNSTTIFGDVYCDGILANLGVVNGDVFANSLSGSIAGQEKSASDLTLKWPCVTVQDLTSYYSVLTIPVGVLSDTNTPGYAQVLHRKGNLVLDSNVQVNGTLIVEGNLTVSGTENVITAKKNLPALLVTGDVLIESTGRLDVQGLAVVEGSVQVIADSTDINVLGGLFIRNSLAEAAADLSGCGNTGILHNGPTWQPFSGQVGGALEFDGWDDYVSVASSSNLQLTSALTISAWIKGDFWGAGSDVDTIVRKGEAAPVNYQLAIADGRVSLMLDDFDNGGFRGNTVLNTGQWYHVAATWDGSTVRIYVNGVIDNDSGVSREGTIGTDTRPLCIGGRAGTDLFDGIIDEVRIYNRALDAGEIYPVPSGSGLVGCWKLDEQGNNNITITAAPCKTAIIVWSETTVPERWGQAAGAFFKSIRRD